MTPDVRRASGVNFYNQRAFYYIIRLRIVQIYKMIFMVCIIAAVTIICLAPVDTINKKLYNSEKRRFKCISEIIVNYFREIGRLENYD